MPGVHRHRSPGSIRPTTADLVPRRRRATPGRSCDLGSTQPHASWRLYPRRAGRCPGHRRGRSGRRRSSDDRITYVPVASGDPAGALAEPPLPPPPTTWCSCRPPRLGRLTTGRVACSVIPLRPGSPPLARLSSRLTAASSRWYRCPRGDPASRPPRNDSAGGAGRRLQRERGQRDPGHTPRHLPAARRTGPRATTSSPSSTTASAPATSTCAPSSSPTPACAPPDPTPPPTTCPHSGAYAPPGPNTTPTTPTTTPTTAPTAATSYCAASDPR